MFDRLIEKAQVKRITPHGLRHTHATLLMKQRIPTSAIADRLGNTPAMILNIYGHIDEELQLETSSAFSSALIASEGSFGGS